MIAPVTALLDWAAAALHVAIIVKGAPWYRLFGAGEEMAMMREAGQIWPDVLTGIIALGLFLWGLYALQSSGLQWPVRLPWLKPILLIITLIYAARGVLLFLALPFIPELATPFNIWSSLICCLYALLHGLCWWKA